ncbi:molecular chaperone TorD family protein [Texcoconibacillus texcoconensis]|uniref:TorA maturation chaperone TorD n=1 Tax=Texcoconibacillus texcoconensis TaxID=1095777 RepID=A0A840QQN9_9BACI|nr:molecular chaperone TorD family protein [Texcoconibacillus texcoconensis]MBB5173617.1 TorA maturation chaperone TorD [Texcoconibacillus texcoconensis]
MTQTTTMQNKSEIYSILAEGLKTPTEDWVSWYNDIGREKLKSLLISFPILDEQEVSNCLPKQLDFKEVDHLYRSYFILPGPQRVVPAESIYKQWTVRNSAFALSKGFLMGDSAEHMNNIFKELDIEIPEEFSFMPDHLILQLELLSLLEENGNEEFVNEFIKEHLDWTEDLVAECTKKQWSGFYYLWIQLIHMFFHKECWKC